MASPLLTTKLYLPQVRRDLVTRPRLLDRLDAGLAGRLNLVTAPAGFGKTTLISFWLRRLTRPAAWLSLDEGDNDPARFLNHLAATLQRVVPGAGRSVQDALQLAQTPPLEALMTSLINDLTLAARDFVLVLDDYHLIRRAGVHRAVAFLLDRQPPAMHLVMATRHDPPLPIPRWLVRGEVTVTRAAELRFTEEEAAVFLNDLMGLDLSAEDVAALEAHTEGWIAGLHLAAVSLRDQVEKHDFVAAVTGSQKYVLDYLMDEVLSQQPEEIQVFLRRTSVLEAFCGPLCDAVLGRTGSPEIIRRLKRDDLFLTALDEKDRWFRYHHLFAGVLSQRLRDTEAELIPELHRRSSLWFEVEGRNDEAVQHALLARDYDRAAGLMERIGRELVIHEDYFTLVNWVSRLPKEALHSRPVLCAYYAWTLFLAVRFDLLDQLLDSMKKGGYLNRAPGMAEHFTVLRGLTAYLRRDFRTGEALVRGAARRLEASRDMDALLARGAALWGLAGILFHRGELDQAEPIYAQAVELNLQAGSFAAVLAAIGHWGYLMLARGWRRRLRCSYDQALDLMRTWTDRGEHRGRMLRSSMIYVRLCFFLYENNELVDAAQYLSQALEIFKLGGVAHERFAAYLALAYLRRATGDLAGALDLLPRLRRLRGESQATPGLIRDLVDYSWASLLLLLESKPGQPDTYLAEAAHWASSRGLDPEDEFDHRSEKEYLVLARLLLAQRRTDEAAALLERLILAAKKSGRNGDLIQYLAARALVFQAQDRTAAAVEALSQALSLAEPEGYIRTFVDQGPAMKELLRVLADGNEASTYAARLIEVFPKDREEEKKGPVRAGALVEPLTEREVAILRRMSVLFSNKEIAEDLHLSLNTIKWYVKNIFGKLAVENRREAVSKARDLGLI
ncbi:MAG: LuxR C-terminal-related transcriptional regulator [Thermodesulfobacteriota bacterium]